MQKRLVIRFKDEKLKKDFLKLKTEDSLLFNNILSTLDKIRENAFYGTQIKKKLFPKEWKEFTNLWKCNLTGGWRLIYSIASPDNPEEVILIAIILEWMNHKDYEKKFKY